MMKNLFLKSVLFFLLLLLIKVPFTNKDASDDRKTEFFSHQFNTVFIGSSRTNHAVIPPYFDLLTQPKTRSYNFGIPGGLPPETFDWGDELIEGNPSIRYIFFELSGGFVTESRAGARLTFANYLRALKRLSFEKFSAYHDNLAAEFFKPHLSLEQPDYNIPFEKKELGAHLPASPKILQHSHLYNQSVEQEDFAVAAPLNEEYWKRVIKLIELAESKRIRLYFFIPPRLETENELQTVYPIYQKLDKKYKLSVAHYEDGLYRDDTSVDDFHLNHKGAIQFTKNMAETFNTLSEPN